MEEKFTSKDEIGIDCQIKIPKNKGKDYLANI